MHRAAILRIAQRRADCGMSKMHHSPVARLPLQDLALTPGSLKAYNKQLNNFLTHPRLSHQQLLTAPAHQLDRLVAVFIQHSYDTDTPVTYASHALHAVVYCLLYTSPSPRDGLLSRMPSS